MHDWSEGPYPTLAPVELGTSVAFLPHGDDGEPFRFEEAAIGIPYAATGSSTGKVRLVDMDDLDYTQETIDAPTGDYAFGQALLAVDLVQTHETTTHWLGGGLELVVGAPGVLGSGDDCGTVSWYYAKADKMSLSDRSSYEMVYGGTLSLPSSSNPNKGRALAAGAHEGGLYPWLAVASGDYTYILDYDPGYTDMYGNPAPFHASSLTSIHQGSSALFAWDVDRDGDDELIAGSDADEQLYLYQDVSTSRDWSTVDQKTINSAYGSANMGFGHSVTAGPLLGEFEDEVVVAGTPWGNPASSNPQIGGFCYFTVPQTSSVLNTWPTATIAPECYWNPVWYYAAGWEQFGYTVAIADVVPLDGFGHGDTDYSEIPELLIGEPGGRAHYWEQAKAGSFTDYDSGGLVNVFRGGPDDDGYLRFQPLTLPDYLEPTLFPIAQIYLPGTTGTQRAGSAMAIADRLGTEFNDVIIGAPGATVTIGGTNRTNAGAVYTSNAEPSNGWDHEDGGYYTTYDSDQVEQYVRISRPSNLRMSVRDEFTVRLVKDGDLEDICGEWTTFLSVDDIDYVPGSGDGEFEWTLYDEDEDEDYTLNFTIFAEADVEEYVLTFNYACKDDECGTSGHKWENCDIQNSETGVGSLVLERADDSTCD